MVESGVVLAFELNREAEGLKPAQPLPESAAGATGPIVPWDRTIRPRGELTDAVRLTREAVFAWIKLLHSPAVVTIPR